MYKVNKCIRLRASRNAPATAISYTTIKRSAIAKPLASLTLSDIAKRLGNKDLPAVCLAFERAGVQS